MSTKFVYMLVSDLVLLQGDDKTYQADWMISVCSRMFSEFAMVMINCRRKKLIQFEDKNIKTPLPCEDVEREHKSPTL